MSPQKPQNIQIRFLRDFCYILSAYCLSPYTTWVEFHYVDNGVFPETEILVFSIFSRVKIRNSYVTNVSRARARLRKVSREFLCRVFVKVWNDNLVNFWTKLKQKYCKENIMWSLDLQWLYSSDKYAGSCKECCYVFIEMKSKLNLGSCLYFSSPQLKYYW